MERARVLIIEDCENARRALHDALARDYEVDSFGDAESALAKLNSIHYDLVIVDLGLPGMDGYRFCASLRSNDDLSDVSIIILSGRTAVEDKLMGFSLGAGDFVQKPVDLRELRARIQIQLNRKSKEEKVGQFVQVGPFHGNLLKQVISYWERGRKIEIRTSPLEFKLLHFFLTHIDHIVSRHQLLDQVWGSDRHVTDRSVDALISKVRQKLGPYAHYLQSVHGAGYRFSSPIEISTSDESLQPQEKKAG